MCENQIISFNFQGFVQGLMATGFYRTLCVLAEILNLPHFAEIFAFRSKLETCAQYTGLCGISRESSCPSKRKKKHDSKCQGLFGTIDPGCRAELPADTGGGDGGKALRAHGGQASFSECFSQHPPTHQPFETQGP